MDFETLYYSYRDRSISFEEVMGELAKGANGAPLLREEGGQFALYYISPYHWKPTVRDAMEHFLFDRIELSKYPGLVAAAIKEARDQKNDPL